jgi:hypothetical protein
VDVTTATGRAHTVILKAKVQKIDALAVPSTMQYDSTLVCDQSTSDLVLKNPNPVAVTLLNAQMIGTDAPDFSIGRPLPITIAAGGEEHLPISFQPTWDAALSVSRVAQCALEFDLPKTHTRDTISVQGVAMKRELSWRSTQNGSVYSSNEFTIPIYAENDLTPYAPLGYRIKLSYDSAHLEFLDLITGGTLTPTNAGYGTFATHRGRDTITYSQRNDVPLAGGGPTEKRPLIYLRFRSHTEHEDQQTFSGNYPIKYVIDLLSSRVPEMCVERTMRDGAVEIVSVCSPSRLAEKSLIPKQMWIGPAYPNPFNPESSFEYDIAPDPATGGAANVRIELIASDGTVVQTLVDGVKQPGYYTAHISGSDLASGAYIVRMRAPNYDRLRKVLLVK